MKSPYMVIVEQPGRQYMLAYRVELDSNDTQLNELHNWCVNNRVDPNSRIRIAPMSDFEILIFNTTLTR